MTVEILELDLGGKEAHLRVQLGGAIDLAKTMGSGQTNEASWQVRDSFFEDVEIFEGNPIKIRIRQPASEPSNILEILLLSLKSIGESEILEPIRYIERLFRLDDDLAAFYRTLRKDPLAEILPSLRGLRLMRATNPYESIICSICSQNNSVKRFHRMIGNLKQRWGRRIKFDGNTPYFTFPTPYQLSQLNQREARLCGLGYRAPYVIQVSKSISKGETDLEALGRQGYDEALEHLLQLPGVGPKVADCFCLYGLGYTEAAPLDRWVERALSHFYPGEVKIGSREARYYLRRRFGEWAGYAQLYLFHYARSMWGTSPRKLKKAS